MDAASQKDDLVRRDYALGLLAEVTEARFRLQRAERDHADLIQRLQTEMTRCFEAETRVAVLERELGSVSQLRKQVADMQSSMTWRIGRLVLTPVRVLRRIVRR